jgi:hypothetical protein
MSGGSTGSRWASAVSGGRDRPAVAFVKASVDNSHVPIYFQIRLEARLKAKQPVLAGGLLLSPVRRAT